jgi:hypothetical protein
MKYDTHGKDAAGDDVLALTPFDISPDGAPARRAIMAEDPADAPVILFRNPDTNSWEGAASEPEPEPEEEAIAPPPLPEEKGGWTVALLCMGVALVAACLLLPLAEENHQLAYQREKLRADLEQIKKQVEVNSEFLSKVTDDPTLAERLAERQMKFVREGTSVLDIPGSGKEESSPFLLVSLPPPNAMLPYQSLGGPLSFVGRYPRMRLYVLGTGLLLLAAGVVLGGGNKQTFEEETEEG